MTTPTNGRLHALATTCIGSLVIGGFAFLWNLNAKIATIEAQLQTTNARTAEILDVLDTIAPRTDR